MLNWSKVHCMSWIYYIIWSRKIDQAKIEAITKMPLPNSVNELQQFLCMITYLRKFTLNLVTYPHPAKKRSWIWTRETLQTTIADTILRFTYETTRELIQYCNDKSVFRDITNFLKFWDFKKKSENRHFPDRENIYCVCITNKPSTMFAQIYELKLL